MRRSPHRISPVEFASHVEQNGDLLHFAQSLDAYRDPEQLLRSLPVELSAVVSSNTTALIYMISSDPFWNAVDSEGSAIGLEPEPPQWQDDMREFLVAYSQPVVVSLDGEATSPAVVRFFRKYGNQSLCVLPLNKTPERAGVLCFAKKEADGFSEREVGLLSFLADYVGLAIDDRLNFAHFEAIRDLGE